VSWNILTLWFVVFAKLTEPMQTNAAARSIWNTYIGSSTLNKISICKWNLLVLYSKDKNIVLPFFCKKMHMHVRVGGVVMHPNNTALSWSHIFYIQLLV
jgi:hypothetical protein